MSTPKFVFLQQPPMCPVPANDWEMWSAMATGAAAGVALFLPFLLRWLDNRAQERKVADRTAIAGPELAADVMQVDWQLVHQIDIVKQALNEVGLTSREQYIDAKLASGGLLFSTFPGRTLLPGDMEHLTTDVKQKLSELRAQVFATNAMARQLMNGPFGRFATKGSAMEALLPDFMVQLGAVHDACVAAMASLEKHLPKQLNQMGASIANQGTMVKEFVASAARHRPVKIEKPEA